MKRLGGIGLICLLCVMQAAAQGPPIFTDTPIMLGLEGRGVRTFGKITWKENGRVYMQPVAVPYNITHAFQVGGIVPFVGISPSDSEGHSGLGDVQLFTKWQIHQNDGKGKTFRTLIKLSQSFPTGSTEGGPPLGSGAWHTTVGLVSGYVTTAFGLYGEVAYSAISDSAPDHVIGNLALGVPLLPQQYPPKQINLFLEMNGKLTSVDQGDNLFISPGVQWIIGRKVLIESGIQIPLMEDIPETLATKYTLILGTRILIF